MLEKRVHTTILNQFGFRVIQEASSIDGNDLYCLDSVYKISLSHLCIGFSIIIFLT